MKNCKKQLQFCIFYSEKEGLKSKMLASIMDILPLSSVCVALVNQYIQSSLQWNLLNSILVNPKYSWI
jgi:hypothetical protein